MGILIQVGHILGLHILQMINTAARLVTAHVVFCTFWGNISFSKKQFFNVTLYISISRPHLCNDFQRTVTEDYCVSGETSPSQRNSPLVGSISLDSSPVKTFTNTQLTSLVSTIIDEHTVIVTTTSTGRLIKVNTPHYLSDNN